MSSSRESDPNEKKTRRRPATTPLARERQLVSLAVDLAEKQLLEGTASAQVVTHYLKLGSSREMLEQERMIEEVRLLQIKRETLASQQRTEELYEKALNAFRAYSGQPPDPTEDSHRAYDD